MTTNLQDEIYSKLAHIRGSFIQKNMRQSPYFGAFTSSAFDTASLPGRLLKGYSGFRTGYTASVKAAADVTTATVATGVKYRAAATNTYADIPADATATSVPITSTLPGNSYVDLNLSGLLVDPSGDVPKLKDDLNDVAALYSVLEDGNYATLVGGGTPLKIAKYSPPGVTDYEIDATANTYIGGGARIDTLMSKLTGTNVATTSSIPIGRYTTPDRNAITAVTTEALPPVGTSDIVVSLAPAAATATFETIAPPIPLQAPTNTTGVSVVYKISGSVRLAADLPSGAAATPFSIYLRRGNLMVKLHTVAAPTSTWTALPDNIVTSSLTAADAPIQLVLAYTHNKNNAKLLISNFAVSSTVTGSTVAANNAASVFAPETDLFVVRRLMLLYTLMSNFYIAMTIYDRLFTTGDEPAVLKNLVSLTYQNITQLNYNTVRSGDSEDNSDGVTYIAERVSARAQDFYTMGKKINELSEQTTEKKVSLRDDLQRMETTGIVKARSSRYATATIAISLVVVFGLVAVLVIPSSPLVKVTGTAAVVVAALLLNMAIKKLYDGNVAESFTTDPPGSLVYDLSSYPGGVAASNKADIMTYYENTFKKQVSDYLSNTIYLALLLQSHKAYGNVNFSMEKEQRFYTDVVDQIDTQGKKVRDTSGLLRLDQITERARMTLALSVLIIVASAAFAVMLLRLRFPGLIPFVLIVAAILIASSLFFYVMDTNARVRTNGSQRYWQQPDLRVI